MKNYYHIISIQTLEILISRIELQSNHNQSVDIYKEALKALVDGYEEQLKYYPDMFRFFDINLFARAYMISAICPECIDIETLSGGFSMVFNSPEMRDLINELSYMLIK